MHIDKNVQCTYNYSIPTKAKLYLNGKYKW